MKTTSMTRSLIFIALSAMLWCLYFQVSSQAHYLVHAILHNTAESNYWTNWIYELYPRLQTEKWRFDENFFLQKFHQLLLRNTIVVQLVIPIMAFWNSIKTPLKNKSSQLFNVSISSIYLNKYITPLLYGCLAYIFYDALVDLKDLAYFKALYSPVGIGKLLLPYFPSITFLWLLYSTLIGCIIAVVFFPYKWVSASICLLAFLYYQLIFFGFDKYDHGYATLTYAMMVYPFVLYEQDKNKNASTPAWGIVLIQLLICLSYFYGGMEKILISGWDWVALNNLQQHLMLNGTALGIELSKFPILCKGLSIGVILFQCGFILLPFIKPLKYILLPIGFIFHTLTWLLLSAGGIINPWWFMYLFFLFPLQSLEIKSNLNEQ